MANHTVVPLAADSAEGLTAAAHALAERLRDPRGSLGVVPETALRGSHRRALVVSDPSSLPGALEAFDPGRVGPFEAPVLAFLFTGQGSQHIGMTQELRGLPAFDEAFSEVTAALDPHLPRSLEAVLDEPNGPLGDTAWTQPALFAVEVALSRLLGRWGIHPDVVIGHSVGELAAACVAGILTLEDAARLVTARGRLMGALPKGGAMLAIKGDSGTVFAAVEATQGVDVAGVNAPGQVVISGDEGPVAAVGEAIAKQGLRATALAVSHAFHSHRMEPMLGSFRQQAAPLAFGPPATTLVSNLTASVHPPGDTSPTGPTAAEYWVRHVREPVRFADGVDHLAALGVTVGVEVGPHPVLAALCRSCGLRVPIFPAARRKRSDRMMIARALAGLWEAGVDLDWQAIGADLHGKR